jgi:Rrf2 family protein
MLKRNPPTQVKRHGLRGPSGLLLTSNTVKSAGGVTAVTRQLQSQRRGNRVRRATGLNRGWGRAKELKISQKGLYALEAVMTLGHHYGKGTLKIREIAMSNDLPEKFLELILLELKNARIVESVRGAKGGYQLRRAPSEIPLSDIIRLVDGPLAPFGDADQLRSLIASDADHRALYEVFLRVRDSAAKILESTTVADLVGGSPRSGKRGKSKTQKSASTISIVHKESGS